MFPAYNGGSACSVHHLYGDLLGVTRVMLKLYTVLRSWLEIQYYHKSRVVFLTFIFHLSQVG